jgi:iron(III) transport system permease protein
MDPSYEEAARTIARPWRVTTRILLPAACPAAALGGIVVFALAFSELGVPMFLRVRVYPVAVFARLGGVDYAPGEAFALVLPLLAVSLGLLLTERWIGKRRPLKIRGLRLSREPIPLGIWRKPAAAFVWIFTLLELLPLGALFHRALTEGGFLRVGQWLGSSIPESLVTAALAATALTGTGLVLGHAIARIRRGAGALDALALLAFVTPATALGVGLIQVWNHPAASAVYGSAAILVVGYAARYSILGLRPLAVAVGQTPPSLEEAAAVAGAGYFRRLLRIVVPVHFRALAITWLLIAVFCLRDLETSVLYYPPGKEPLAVRIFTLEANGPEPIVAALACTLVGMTGGVVGLGLLVLRAGKSS